ncbi:hypothetical protein C0581_01925 [Candidatus Parcubacteria bacterium]|nr:MAG: hypothetical protein C0581_01925 [Candidatus Parcubacteria bacterium]
MIKKERWKPFFYFFKTWYDGLRNSRQKDFLLALATTCSIGGCMASNSARRRRNRESKTRAAEQEAKRQKSFKPGQQEEGGISAGPAVQAQTASKKSGRPVIPAGRNMTRTPFGTDISRRKNLWEKPPGAAKK